MKKFILSCALLTAAGLTNAQTPSNSDQSKTETGTGMPTSMNVTANEFAKVEMTIKDRKAIFTGLPEEKNKAYVILTNSAGETINQAVISPERNEFKLGNLPNDLYFVTIVHKNKSRKAFTVKI